MDAKEARRQATEQAESKARIQLLDIRLCIQEAVKRGDFSVNYYKPLLMETRIKLEEEKYELHEHFDQKDGDTITIKW